MLPRIAAGTLYSAIGMSEHGAGSDLAAVQTRAVATDGGWLLNGTKVWTSGAHVAHQIVVLAQNQPSRSGSTATPVSASSSCRPTPPGITISPIQLMNGEHHFNEVTFDDSFVADGDVLGEIGDGWHQVTAELGFERSGPERILSTATLIFAAVRALAEQDVDDRTAAEVGDLMARMISLRQLSVSVARALSDGGTPRPGGAGQGPRHPLRAGLGRTGGRPDRQRRPAFTGCSAAARPAGHRAAAFAVVHAARRDERGAARSGREGHGGAMNELTQLVDDIGRRSFEPALGHRGLPDAFDDALWRNLEETGLSRLTSSQEAGPAEAAIVLSGLARHAGAVPIAETDLLAAWLAGRRDRRARQRAAHRRDRRRRSRRRPDHRDGGRCAMAALGRGACWRRAPPTRFSSRVVDDPQMADGHNLAGEPRGSFAFERPADGFACRSIRPSATSSSAAAHGRAACRSSARSMPRRASPSPIPASGCSSAGR